MFSAAQDLLNSPFPFVANLPDTTTPSVGASAIAGPVPLTVLNAQTTYGIDTSVENNYGLGADFMSTTGMATAQAAQTASPSVLWLVAFVLIAWWLL